MHLIAELSCNNQKHIQEASRHGLRLTGKQRVGKFRNDFGMILYRYI